PKIENHGTVISRELSFPCSSYTPKHSVSPSVDRRCVGTLRDSTFLPSDIIAFRGTDSAGYRLVLSPSPAADFRRILAVLGDIRLVVDERVADRLFRIGCPRTQLRHAVDHILHQMKAVEVIEHAQPVCRLLLEKKKNKKLK